MSQKRDSTTFDKIRVLLIHENELARSVWKKVLEKSGHIIVIGTIVSLEGYRLPEGTRPPEIIIASISILRTGVLRADLLKTMFGIRPRITILAESKADVKVAFKEGADWAAEEPIDTPDLITRVRALSGDSKRLCAEHRDNFSKISSGDSHKRKFGDLVSSTIQLIFHPDLVNPEYVALPPNHSLAGRLVFRNQARDHEFWIDTRESHRAKYVTTDIYNKILVPEDITLLGKYLSESHGLFGLAIGRSSTSTALEEMSIALFENEQKVVLPLDISALCEMLEYKAGGINPVCLLQDRYQRLIAAAGG